MAVSRVRADHAKGLRELQADHPEPARRVVVSLDPHDRTTEDGIELLHHTTFLQQFWQGAVTCTAEYGLLKSVVLGELVVATLASSR